MNEPEDDVSQAESVEESGAGVLVIINKDGKFLNYKVILHVSQV